jgi:hypothetical protein
VTSTATTRLVLSWMENSTYNVCNQMVSTVKKSQETTPRPGLHLRRTSSRCQRSSVCGVTRNDAPPVLGKGAAGRSQQNPAELGQSAVDLGRPAWRRSTRSCCLSTRTSRSLAPAPSPWRTSRRVNARTINQDRNSIGGWYGATAQDANPGFRAPQLPRPAPGPLLGTCRAVPGDQKPAKSPGVDRPGPQGPPDRPASPTLHAR